MKEEEKINLEEEETLKEEEKKAENSEELRMFTAIGGPREYSQDSARHLFAP